MGRFAYQPLNEEQMRKSQTGQLIMGRQDAHISANKNGIIVSKTKEIEDKITDINELKYDVDEQSDVITNLIEDLERFLENQFKEAEEAQTKTYIYAKSLLIKMRYIDDTERSMKKKINRIREIIDEFKRANDLQIARLDKMEEEAEEALPIIGNMAYVENEYNTIMAYYLSYKD